MTELTDLELRAASIRTLARLYIELCKTGPGYFDYRCRVARILLQKTKGSTRHNSCPLCGSTTK